MSNSAEIQPLIQIKPLEIKTPKFPKKEVENTIPVEGEVKVLMRRKQSRITIKRTEQSDDLEKQQQQGIWVVFIKASSVCFCKGGNGR